MIFGTPLVVLQRIKYSMSTAVNSDLEKNRSTILQLLTVMNKRTEALDDGIQIDMVYLDFCKAFDCVPHKRLIKKLEGYGIKGILLEWFKNFLN